MPSNRSNRSTRSTNPHRSLFPAFTSAAVGALLGGAAIFGVVHAASQEHLPSANAVNSDDALLGGVEYGTR